MNEKLSLTELQLIIRDSLYLALPDFYWVIAEISELKENFAGHCYLELIEKLPDEQNARARVRAVIWSKRYRFLKPFFTSSTGEPLKEGMKVLIRVKVEYHELYGLSLVISDIDPAYTLGEMAMKRQMIIKRLEEEGIISMNRELEFPLVPQRIAVISSSKAAGYSDFLKQLKNNSYGYVFYTALFESAMQGEETESGIISALDKISENTDKFDAVAIIRGGGSQSDLSWFDNYNIAFHITQFPIPVLTGIGHEKDSSVTDIVAFMALKTPTAVADFLIGSIADAEARLMEMSTEISEFARVIINDGRERLGSSRMRIIPAARLMLSVQKELLSKNIIDMISTGKDFLTEAGMVPVGMKSRLSSATRTFSSGHMTSLDRKRSDLVSIVRNKIGNMKKSTESLANSLTMLDPENVLRRGYSITSLNGKIIKRASEVINDDIIETRFSDGTKKSKII